VLAQRDAKVDVGDDGVVTAFTLPAVSNPPITYLVRLRLSDSTGTRSENLYWLSSKPDVLDWSTTSWNQTLQSEFADLTALAKLPPAKIDVAATRQRDGGDEIVTVTLDDLDAKLGFFLRAEVTAGETGYEVTPIRWDDNYVTLLPHERTTITARYRTADLAGARPWVRLEGMNVAEMTVPVSDGP
jgi:exo-1,4-beta-D-glucosaminidase